MATDTKPEEVKSRGVRFQDDDGEWIELDVKEPKLLAQLRNQHERNQEIAHAKTREAFRKVISKLVQEEITEELQGALKGQAIMFRMGTGDDADEDVVLMSASLITLRQRPKRSDAKD